MRIALPEAAGAWRAGRFFMLRPVEGLAPAIPRPFSIYRQLPDGSLEFLIKVIGSGTRALAAMPIGAEILAVGPLGNGLAPLDDQTDPWVLLAGGIGSAPFYMGIQRAVAGTAEVAPVRPESITMIYGAATASMLYDFELFEELGVRVLAATDDGTRGFQG
ncbi:MAG: dihydroorotate dehydrogenase electron transfer subunit, partial [Planctomycetota bacterium]